MEDKPAASSAAESPALAEPPSSRRRAGGHKRKANTLSTSTSSSTPSKRLTREKAAVISHSNSPIHNGPLTRARQSPNNFATPASASARGVKREEKVAVAEAVAAAAEAERSKLEELEATIEAEFEALRSRDSNSHVVPNHCGWFSWTKIHQLEEQALPSFFNRKSQIRTPEVYMDIRNWIIKKFHANPNTQIELKDLSELEVADLDARQEVLEFLDYWGLINFHPFPQLDSAANADGDGAAKKDSLLEKLFRFEDIQPRPPVVPKPSLTTPSVYSGLFPDSAIAEELARLEGPSVEYHCNSCSADCSRKRYHCQKQADYDLCADCFNNGKFGSNMSSSDFIIMEPADAAGVGSGKWTDQETLLLLEALELYNENWNEIAEHVATKTKAQCILHFVQMPIEDAFFDCVDDVDDSSKETAEKAATISDASAFKDLLETGEEKASVKEDQPLTSPMEVSKPEDPSAVKDSQENAEMANSSKVIVSQNNLKSGENSEMKAGQKTDEDKAVKALTEAFEAVGYNPTPENQLSFSEVGNPVMALAAFLSKLVGPDVATASAHSSLKSLSRASPGMQLAARHCFLLEDPPDDIKEQAGGDCTTTETADQNAQKNSQEEENQKGNKATSDLDNDNQNNKKSEDSDPINNKALDLCDVEPTMKVNDANEAGIVVAHEEVEPSKSKEFSNLELNGDQPPSTVKDSDEIPPNSLKEMLKDSSVGDHSQVTRTATVDLMPSEQNKPQSVTSMSVEEPNQAAENSSDVSAVTDSLSTQKPSKSLSVWECSQPTEESKDVDMLSLQPSEENKSQQPVTTNSAVENAEDQKCMKKEKPDCKGVKEDDKIDKIKRTAVSSLSAAAVKAKLLANQEEDQIRQLAASLIEKQLHKLEVKLTFFNEMDNVIMRVREQLERSRQRLYQERAQIIATRLGLPGSSSRGMPQSLPANRIPMNFPNSVARPPLSMASLRPSISRPMGTLPSNPSNPFVSPSTAGSSIRPRGQDKLSSVGTK